MENFLNQISLSFYKRAKWGWYGGCASSDGTPHFLFSLQYCPRLSDIAPQCTYNALHLLPPTNMPSSLHAVWVVHTGCIPEMFRGSSSSGSRAPFPWNIAGQQTASTIDSLLACTACTEAKRSQATEEGRWDEKEGGGAAIEMGRRALAAGAATKLKLKLRRGGQGEEFRNKEGPRFGGFFSHIQPPSLLRNGWIETHTSSSSGSSSRD